MSATGADPQSERTRLRRGSRTWGLIRRTLPLGRSIGSLFYLISIGLIASWIIAVFFGVSFYFLMPRSAKLEPGLSPSGTNLDASSAETPSLMQSTSRLDRLSTPPPPEPPQPMGDAAADKDRPIVAPGSQITANVNPHRGRPRRRSPTLLKSLQGKRLAVELGTLFCGHRRSGPDARASKSAFHCARTAGCLAILPLSITSQAARAATLKYPNGTAACPSERN